MKNITFRYASEIAKIIDGNLCGNECFIDKISLNSKEKGENWCFFAIKGAHFDGNDFVEEALNNGAKLIVTNKQVCVNASTIYVENTVVALGKLAKSQINGTKIIGVTGSVGKTTTKEMIISVLKQDFCVCGTNGNQNNEIGVPLTLFEINNDDFCVVEMGMRERGEIDYLASICTPESVVITNCGSSHLEILKTKENIFLAKTEILNYMPKYAVLPNEKRFKLLDFAGIKPYFFDDENNYIYDCKYSNEGIKFSIKLGKDSIENITLHSFYIHNVNNALIATILGKIYGISESKIKRGIESFSTGNMREEYLEINGISIINDCYNSSFESVKSALISFKNYCKIMKKTPAVLFGDILEAGEDSEAIHMAIGEICNELKIDNVFCLGEYAKSIINVCNKGILFNDKVSAAQHILNTLGCSDSLLIKASRNAHFEEIIELMKANKNE